MTEAAAHRPADAASDARLSWSAALGLLLRTTAFRFAALWVTAFVVLATLAGAMLQSRVVDALTFKLFETLSAEADGLADISAVGGEPALVSAVEERMKSGKRGLYVVLDTRGGKIAGNLSHWPVEIAGTPGGTFRIETGTSGEALAAGVTRTLASGLRFVVGRPLDAEQALASRLRWLTFGSFGLLALLGVAGGLWASRAARARVAGMSATAAGIMAGDMSRRLPFDDTGDEFDDLARNLNAMLDRIGELMAGLREVSDNIAHDLRTPLSRLRTRAEAVLRAPSASPAEMRDALARVIEDADDLIKTFSAMLLVARLESGALDGTREVFDAAALVADVVELYEPVAEESGARIDTAIAGPALISANRQLVGQAVANLVDNALKYGAGGAGVGPVAVAVAASGGTLTITVADRGPGIPAADRDRATRRFVRLEASRTKPGTGIGLSLVAAVARLHHGAIDLQDNAPGLRVILRLPAHADAGPAPEDTWPKTGETSAPSSSG